ncbi:hypothetical protein Tco_1318104 [Tanacetum coccineum]
MPEASPKDVYDYYVHGLVDTVYINDETLKELQEFPPKVQTIIKGYKEIFARGRELFLKMRSNYPIFDKEQKLLVPSITVAQLGVSNKDYPNKDEKIECLPPTIDDLVYSFIEVLTGSSKIGTSPRQKDKIKINYCLKNLLIYSKFQERIDDVELKVLSDFEDQIELFSGLLAPLPEDLKQQLCRYMTRNTRHYCNYCSKVLEDSPVVTEIGFSICGIHTDGISDVDFLLLSIYLFFENRFGVSRLRNLNDQIIVPVPDSSQHCAVCGTPVDGPIREYRKERTILIIEKCEDKIYELKDKFNSLSIEIRKITQEAKELRESEARARSQKIIIDDDDDDLGFYAVHPNTIHTPVSQNVEPKDSLIMGDGHINTTPETETISVETLVSNPSESDDFSLGECNLFDIDDSYYEKSTSRLAHLAPISPEIVEVCVNDDDTDDDDDYDDDFYDCVDIEEDGGEIDFDISKIVDISLREKLVESYLLIEKINAFSLSPPIPISPIFCPSSTIPVVDLDLPLEEADVTSFSDDSILRGIESDRDSGEDTTSIDDLPLDNSMILSEYESFTFDDEPGMAEVNVFDEINTSELSYPGIGENVV